MAFMPHVVDPSGRVGSMAAWQGSAWVLALLIIVTPAHADGQTVVRTYEAPAFEVAVGPATVRGVETSGRDPSEGAMTRDGRLDVGRIVLDVPSHARTLVLEADDDVSSRVPLKVETFGETGGVLATRYACAAFGGAVTIDARDAERVLVRVLANDPQGSCAVVGGGYATRGELRATFI